MPISCSRRRSLAPRRTGSRRTTRATRGTSHLRRGRTPRKSSRGQQEGEDVTDITIAAGDWTIESNRPDLASMELTLGADGKVQGTHKALDLSGSTTGEW